jgi:hypothetical protein
MKKSYIIKCKTEEATNEGLVYRKEVIYEGTWGTRKKGYFKVDEKLIDHWVVQASTMIGMGFKVNLPVEHTTDPEANRGKVLRFEKGVNKKGKKSLYSVIEFATEEAAKLAKTSDVSIYSPETYEMGNGYIALRPITHVALTDYPLVPGLEDFETIAASTTEESMTLLELATALGLTPDEGADDAAVSELIVSAFKELKASAEKPAPKNDDPAVQASLLDLVKKSRKLQIDGLVAQLKLTPAEAKDWAASYAPKDFAASQTDGFDMAFSLAEKRTPYADLSKGAGSQSPPRDPSKNPVLIDAQKRADAAKARK